MHSGRRLIASSLQVLTYHTYNRERANKNTQPTFYLCFFVFLQARLCLSPPIHPQVIGPVGARSTVYARVGKCMRETTRQAKHNVSPVLAIPRPKAHGELSCPVVADSIDDPPRPRTHTQNRPTRLSSKPIVLLHYVSTWTQTALRRVH